MGSVVRELRIPPDRSRIARALSAESGLAVLASDLWDGPGPRGGDSARFSFVASSPVDESGDIAPESSHEVGWGGHSAAPLWVGVVPYESSRHLERKLDPRPAPPAFESSPRWYRYDAVVRIDHETGIVSVEADSVAAATRMAETIRERWGATADPCALELNPCEATTRVRDDHVERVKKGLEYIRAGDIYEVNLARKIDLRLRGGGLALHDALTQLAPTPYGFLLEHPDLLVCGASPELAIVRRGTSVRTAPIKGTRPRGADAVSDARLATELDRSPKERAELTMAVDLHRNDLGRVAENGTVRVLGEPVVRAGRTVWSRTAEISARVAPSRSNADLLRAVLPCGSVTGAPKVRAMQVIAELEEHRRGLYTGAFGYIGRDGSLTLAVAIRTMVFGPLVAGERSGSYFTGGGIVADSDPGAEFDETRWKAVHLSELARVSPF